MQISDFKDVIKTFADPGTELLFEGKQLVISVNGDVLSVEVNTKAGDVYVTEDEMEQPASSWIMVRLARLPLLAARLRETIAPMDAFVGPSGKLLSTLSTRPTDNSEAVDNALSAIHESLRDRSPLETTVMYLTSDAGEGKTSLINELARRQAIEFGEKRSDWLLVPVPLGGRHFLRFDDITVGALQNRYRFPFLYYSSFLALVQMGVIVPAFDGFEEMFVEGSSGEALSAMGILVSSLDSRGAIVVAARRAYFEFESLKSQELLFDTIRSFSVGFGKLELVRWEKRHFIEYCQKRSVVSAEDLYKKMSERLSEDHPLLTRAVLVKRVVDVVQQSASLDTLLSQIQESGADYFSVFVRSIIEREANEKWIDRSGQDGIGIPLLSIEEHFELLAEIAVAMWDSRTDYLKRSNLEFLADYFCEVRRKNAFQARQIRERIRGHALLIPSPNSPQAVEFDHDEFRMFFLGEGLFSQVRALNERARASVLGVLRRGILPDQAQHAFIQAVGRDGSLKRLDAARFMLNVAKLDAQASYTHQNCADIALQLLNGILANGIVIQGMAFGTEALRGRTLNQVEFRDCYWAQTSLESANLVNCTFENCRFAQLRLCLSTTFSNVTLTGSTVDSIVLSEMHRETWDPEEILSRLEDAGVEFGETRATGQRISSVVEEGDAELRDIEKIARTFLRSTIITDSLIQMKLGGRAAKFIEERLPNLIEVGVIEEIENRGAGNHRRFKLGVSIHALNKAIIESHGLLDKFFGAFEADGSGTSWAVE